MKTQEQQVEELEKDFELNILDCDKIISEDLIKRAKLLKSNIFNLLQSYKNCPSAYELNKENIYPDKEKCQNLIDRLNKIIGEDA